MNLFKLTCCVCLLGAGLTGKADNTAGINLYESEMYSVSKNYFLKQLHAASSPEEKAEACYYLGKSYLKLNRPDSAHYYFTQGIETSATYPFNQIGASMLALEESSSKGAADKELQKTIEASFKDAIKTDKKNIRLPLAVAEAYAYVKDYAKAEEYI
ncbi:MAG: tetratricopeptide repeat protein, partial [Prevotellaceae bacterium]|nr:tetratricopeptide repeat protein [Prevotellaceae bacterium]